MTKMKHLCLILIYIVDLSYCLFEDQAGKFDWRQQHIGKTSFMQFDQSQTSNGKRLLVSTEQNVLSSLNVRSGQIVWRQVFEQSNLGKINSMVHSGNYVVMVQGGGSFVRCFNPSTGDMVWEQNFETPSKSARMAMLDGEQEAIVIMTGNEIKVFEVDTGAEVWAETLPNSDLVSYQYTAVHNGIVTAIGVTLSSHVTLASFGEDGSKKDTKTVPAAWITQETQCIVESGFLLCTDDRTSTLQVLALKSPTTFRANLLDALGLSGTSPSLIDLDTDNVFGLRLKDTEVAVCSINNGVIRVVKHLPGASAVETLEFAEKSVFVTLVKSGMDAMTLKGYDLKTGADVPEMSQNVVYPDHHGMPKRLEGLVFKKKDGSQGYRVIVMGADDSLIMLQQTGRVSWLREESLASITSMELVDLPVPPILAKMEDEFGQGQDDIVGLFVKRLKTQFLQLSDFLVMLKNKLRVPPHHHHYSASELEVETDEGNSSDEEGEDEYLTRDEFNLHKMIVAVTASGKVYGIDSQTGKAVWKQFLSEMSPFTRLGQQVLPLFVQRSTAHFPLTPQCTVVGKHRTSGKGMMFTFNPITGAPVEGMPVNGVILEHDIHQLMLLHQFDEHFVRPLVVMDTDFKLHVYPSSSKQMVKDLHHDLYMYVTDVDNSVLTGYKMTDRFTAKQTWTVNIQHENQVITNVVGKRSIEHVHSQGVVLGDRSVLYKYLNPNLIVVTTEGMDNQQKNTVSVYLVDAVSGQIVFSCNHKKVKGPVSVAHSENWIVYDMWNSKHRRTEVSVIELYEGQKQSNATVFSSFDPPPAPLVMRQSYIFPGHISSMAATVTEKGITNKHVMMALRTGALLDLPKMLLDPRRPIEPTAMHKEEGILPYIPELPRPFEATVNYNQSIYGIRGIHTAPAGLESTCLVVAYGLDIFYTRVMPSKMFDVLKEDFDYVFIASVLFGMISVSFISRKLAQRKNLNKAWK